MNSTFQNASRTPRRAEPGAFSLVELLVVAGVLSLLLALAAPAFVALAPARKAGIHELAAFLERARSEAVAAGEERIVAFAGPDFPRTGGALRAYAMFAPGEGDEESPPRPVTPWQTLPEGLLFVGAAAFEVQPGFRFRTVHDLPRQRTIPVPGAGGGKPLACVVFGVRGEVTYPEFADGDALHLGLAEGYRDPSTGAITFTSRRRGGGGKEFPNAECLALAAPTGRVGILTD